MTETDFYEMEVHISHIFAAIKSESKSTLKLVYNQNISVKRKFPQQ